MDIGWWIDEYIYGWIDEYMNIFMDEEMNIWIYVNNYGWIDEWIQELRWIDKYIYK